MSQGIRSETVKDEDGFVGLAEGTEILWVEMAEKRVSRPPVKVTVIGIVGCEVNAGVAVLLVVVVAAIATGCCILGTK